MKVFVLSLLLLTLISCHPEFSNKGHRNIMTEKIKACVLNSTASETLKNAFKENGNPNENVVFSTLKSKLDDSDKTILRSCRKDVFKTLRIEKSKHSHGRHLHHPFPKLLNQKNARNLDARDPKFSGIVKKLVTCIEKTPDISDNLKKFLSDNRESQFSAFFRNMKKSLTDEEKTIVRNCIRHSTKSTVQLKDGKQ